MGLIRKLLVGILSLLLLIALIGLALSTSFKLSLGNQNRVENWVASSTLYSSFTANAVSRANDSVGSNNSSPALNNVITQAAHSALPQATFNQDVDSIINSNYEWLEGKSSVPKFSIDLSSAKQNLANSVYSFVLQKVNNLPVCNTSQTLQLRSSTISPLNASCRPAGLSAASVASQISDPIKNSSAYMSGSVISAQNINELNNGSQGQPYYVKLAKLPGYYQWAVRLPILLAVVALLCSLGIFFISRRKRLGVRRIAWLLAISGAILLIIRLLFSSLTVRVDNHLNNNSLSTSYLPAIKNFAHSAEAYMAKVDLYFSTAYLALALLLIILLFTRRRQRADVAVSSNATSGAASPPASPVSPESPKPENNKQPPRPLIQ